MKKKFKKTTAVLLTTVMIVLMIPFSVICASAITQSEFDNRLNNLRNQYPNYSTWYDSFDGGTQCFGFARLVAYNVFGSHVRDWDVSYSIDGVKAGDVLQYGSTSGSGHTVFVTSVSGDTITFVDCNGNGNYSGGTKVRSCGIKWDNTINKWGNMYGRIGFSYRHVSPEIEANENHWYDNYSPADLGTEFYAHIKNKQTGNLFSKEGNDVSGRHPNGEKTQLWRFSKLDDGSYVIRSAENDWCLDVEAGNNIDNLNNQPGGTNVQVYDTYNGTGNQRFFIYNIFGAYYFRPVGMEKVVDMGIDSNLVAVWDYAENFAPQKFDIIRQDFNGYSPENLGENFYAYIHNSKRKQVLTLGNSISSNASDVCGADNSNSTSQIWKFARLGDGSYCISNLENGWFLDVEAGNNINNISEQPNGTNVQAYSMYNGTDNQRFYIYRMYNSYYIKPVGTNKIVDMGSDNGLVAVWGFGEDFDPQKFDIIKIDLDGYFPTDLGTDFYAFIKNIKTHTLLTEKESLTANANNVSGSEANGTKSQMWHFIKNNDGSYTIQNEASKMYLDVDAGDNLDNLTAQPNGTNVTTYNKFNGTNNQKFFIYQMFDAYYVKPVGMNRIVDLALLTGDVAVWDYGRDFDPQKFDIVKFDFENMKVGDTNLDGNIDIRDVTAIQRHLTELEPFNEEQLAVADTNGDGEINIADATHLQMYLAEYDIQLG